MPQDLAHSTPIGQRILKVKVMAMVVVLLLGLPLAAWLDMRDITEALLSRQASDLSSVVTGVRSYYGKNVVGRILAKSGVNTEVTHNYAAIPGAIPVPATLSLELGRVISDEQANISYRFISDFPFKNRAPHTFDAFERDGLVKLRAKPNQRLTNVSMDGFTGRVRLLQPVVMSASCVNCHNTHPESTKRDWKVGDVRGIQEVSISQPIITSLFSFRYLLLYFAFMLATAGAFFVLQRRHAAVLSGLNVQLEAANTFLAAVSTKISRYLSPQIYKSIFSGERDVTIQTERKKLTIFFSDIKDFTATTESTQPEQLTALLNEYFTEMSAIALKHGGTIDKFIGDAILVFFGDPETKGAAEDAKACLLMAFEMQDRLAELNLKWRNSGIAHPFQVRMGINTGFCNVGNFGSDQRMDYTIIGAEANLAARLQSFADAGRIVLSFETYALVRDLVSARAMPPISMKGISREVIPYLVEGILDNAGQQFPVFSEHGNGFTFYLDLTTVNTAEVDHARAVLRQAIKALDSGAANTRPTGHSE